ncbi:plasmolipin [Galendromus occidentalis]|uniref:Plasmolipin n=1 Tax=Galendromus occidentalis TaxID=34638 RepID=A0AAJ6QXC0_9ACAR|nr:plasmolipin [Galendromus occidentalis]
MAGLIDSAQLQAVLQYFDMSYLRTIPGYLKMCQLGNALIGFVFSEFGDPKYSGTTSWFNFVAMTGFWVTILLLLFYLLHIFDKIPVVPWVQVELTYAALWAGLYLIATLAAALNATDDLHMLALAVFAVAGMGLYGTDAFLKFKAYKAGVTETGYSAGPGGNVGGEMGLDQQPEGMADPTSPDHFPAY